MVVYTKDVEKEMFPCRMLVLLLLLPKHFLLEEAAVELVVVDVTLLQVVGHLRSQKLVVMDNHWFEAVEAVLEAVAKQLLQCHSFHLSSHLC